MLTCNLLLWQVSLKTQCIVLGDCHHLSDRLRYNMKQWTKDKDLVGSNWSHIHSDSQTQLLPTTDFVVNLCRSITCSQPLPGLWCDPSCWQSPSRLGRGCNYPCCYLDHRQCWVYKWLAKEKQFEVLNQKREECFIKVICDGKEQLIDIHDVLSWGQYHAIWAWWG